MPTKRSKPYKSPSRKRFLKLREELDEKWASIVLQKEKCEVCPRSAVDPHHFFFKRSFSHLRYDFRNGIALCRQCHAKLHFQDPKGVECFIVEKKGEDWYQELKYDAFNPPENFKFDLEFLEGIKKEFDRFHKGLTRRLGRC